MKKELQDELFNACPLLYRFRHKKDQSKGLRNLMELGICCEDGWYQLLLDASIGIEEVINQIKHTGYEEKLLPTAIWVKERNGELHIYMENENTEISQRVEQATSKSTTICERCGNKGIIRVQNGISCRCDHCYEAYMLDIDD